MTRKRTMWGLSAAVCLVAGSAWITAPADAAATRPRALVGPVHAILPFTTTGTFTVPEGVTGVEVSLWGGGGGGAGADEAGDGGGGGGGSVAWCSVLLPVLSGTYTVTVGGGGDAGVQGAAGTDGGTTTLTGPQGTVLARAGGGSGGGPDSAGGASGTPGPGGTASCESATGMAINGDPSELGIGGPVAEAGLLPPEFTGAGGDGGNTDSAAEAGGTGFALVRW